MINRNAVVSCWVWGFMLSNGESRGVLHVVSRRAFVKAACLQKETAPPPQKKNQIDTKNVLKNAKKDPKLVRKHFRGPSHAA